MRSAPTFSRTGDSNLRHPGRARHRGLRNFSGSSRNDSRGNGRRFRSPRYLVEYYFFCFSNYSRQGRAQISFSWGPILLLKKLTTVLMEQFSTLRQKLTSGGNCLNFGGGGQIILPETIVYRKNCLRHFYRGHGPPVSPPPGHATQIAGNSKHAEVLHKTSNWL